MSFALLSASSGVCEGWALGEVGGEGTGSELDMEGVRWYGVLRLFVITAGLLFALDCKKIGLFAM